VKHLYDDIGTIPLEANIAGPKDTVANIKSVEFVVTTTKNGSDSALPAANEDVKGAYPNAKAKHDYKAEPVADGDDYYDVRYQAKLSPPGKKPIVEKGTETYRIWPHSFELEFTSTDGKAHKKARFRLEYEGGSKLIHQVAGDDGKWSTRPEKSKCTVVMQAPWVFDGKVTHHGHKRTYKVKKNPYQFEFVAPQVADPRKKTKQYVNLDAIEPWDKRTPFGHELKFKVGARGDLKRDAADRLASPGDIVYIQVDFTFATKRNKPKPKLLDDGLKEAATSSNSDRTWKGKAELNADGQATFKVELGHAGGDRCTVKIGADASAGDATLEFETWRRLYYELMFCDVIVSDLKNKDGLLDFPGKIKDKVDARLGAAFIEYKCSSNHSYTTAQAKPGTIRKAAFIGRAGRDQILVGGGLSADDPVAFNAVDNRTTHIKIADIVYSTRTSDLDKELDLTNVTTKWKSPKYMVPLKIQVAGFVWTAKIANPNAYKSKPTLSFSDSGNPDVVAQPYIVKVSEPGQGKSLDLRFERDPKNLPAATLAAPETAKIAPFIASLLGVDELRKHDNKVKLDITHPSNAGTRTRDIKQALEASFNAQKTDVYTHPGLDNAGACRTGPMDAAWFTEVDHKTLSIALPESVAKDGSKPGDYVGALSRTKCPISVKFKRTETYLICGNSSGVRQLFDFEPAPMTAGALASTLCHELGHSMGMTIMAGSSKVPPGTDAAKHVDNGGVYYVDGAVAGGGKRTTGAGPHCASGLAAADMADGEFHKKAGTCVMFDSGGNEDKQPAFCDTCKTYLQARKLTDIKSGWAARVDEEY
jgi:hypothetical protein